MNYWIVTWTKYNSLQQTTVFSDIFNIGSVASSMGVDVNKITKIEQLPRSR